MIRRIALLTLLLLLPAAAVHGEDAAGVRLLDRFGLREDAASWLLLDLASGEERIAHRPESPRIPASTAKLATALAALDLLGPDTRLATELRATGPVEAGILRGDLVLRGGGDPLLDIADLLDLALALRDLGVTGIDGRFLLDDGLLPRFPRVLASEPESAPYNAGVGALTVDFARVRLVPSPQPASVPPLYEAALAWTDDPVALPETARLSRDDRGRDAWSIPRDGRARALPVRDPGLHAARLFRQLAAGTGITLPEPERGRTPAGAEAVARVESAPLRRILRGMLFYSNNQVAETLGMLASRRLASDPPATLEGSAARILDYLRGRLPRVDWEGARLANHSGLGADARLTARQLVALLREGAARYRLPAMMPASGWAGTLRRRLEERDTALRVWAKTGTIDYASAIAGYLLPEDGRMQVFAILLDDPTARAIYDRRPEKTTGELAVAESWNARARAFQDALLDRWLEARAVSP